MGWGTMVYGTSVAITKHLFQTSEPGDTCTLHNSHPPYVAVSGQIPPHRDGHMGAAAWENGRMGNGQMGNGRMGNGQMGNGHMGNGHMRTHATRGICAHPPAAPATRACLHGSGPRGGRGTHRRRHRHTLWRAAAQSPGVLLASGARCRVSFCIT